MDFAFTQEQEMFRQTVRQFALQELLPNYSHWDKTGEFPWEIGRKMAGLGLTGLRIPEKYGGTPADFVTCGIAAEECARGDINATYLVVNYPSAEWIAKFASEPWRQQILPGMLRCDFVVAGAITEPHCGSDAAAMTTRAIRNGDEYVITGEKSSISLTLAKYMIVFAKTDPSVGARGVSAFIVPTDSPGFGRINFAGTFGQRLTHRGSLHLDNVRVPVANLLGVEGRGFYMIMEQFDYYRAVVSLSCIGAAQQSLDETIRYVKSRSAFGQPISRYEAVSFALVDAATMLEAARLLAYKTLWLRDNNMPHGALSAMVKQLAPRTAIDVIHQCMLLHGHSAYGDDYPLAQRMRDVMGYEFGDGTAEIMKIVAARELLGREFSPR